MSVSVSDILNIFRMIDYFDVIIIIRLIFGGVWLATPSNNDAMFVNK